MATQKNSPAEVQQAVRQGAITKEYKADAEKIIRSLNSLRSTEIMSYLQYMQHQYMAVSLLSPGMKAEFEAHATQELDHANRLADRVQQLGGVPIYDPKEISSRAANVGITPDTVDVGGNGRGRSPARETAGRGIYQVDPRNR